MVLTLAVICLLRRARTRCTLGRTRSACPIRAQVLPRRCIEAGQGRVARFPYKRMIHYSLAAELDDAQSPQLVCVLSLCFNLQVSVLPAWGLCKALWACSPACPL
jgi:hypothetical protein